jgi:hypothetical protein
MRYCYNCNRMTGGEPLFCSFCGRTYDQKLCQRLHPNPRSANVCSQCGSREFSLPQPVIPIWLRLLLRLLGLAPGLVLLVLSGGFLLAFIQQLLTNPNALGGLMVVGVVLGLCWYLWMQLPAFLRNKAYRLMTRKKGERNGARH